MFTPLAALKSSSPVPLKESSVMAPAVEVALMDRETDTSRASMLFLADSVNLPAFILLTLIAFFAVSVAFLRPWMLLAPEVFILLAVRTSAF